MEKSNNVLVIGSLSTNPQTRREMIIIRGEMKASIKFYCPVTGNHFRTKEITSTSNELSQEEAVRAAIQNFIDGRVYIEDRCYDRDIQCAVSNKINAVIIQVGEPFKSLFEQIFDATNWQIPAPELERSDARR